MAAQRPKTVLVVNNNLHQAPGHYTQLVIQHLKEAGLPVREARTVEAVDACAKEVADSGSDVGLIVTCGSPVVLTEPVDVGAHVTKTTAALLHFPNAPVVGICFGMQLLAVLYGGSLVAQKDSGHAGGEWELMRHLESPARLLEGFPSTFTQWATNYIFVERIPSRFIPTLVDSQGRYMAMEHAQEHVYGVQFHPEKLHDGIGHLLIDRIVALAGQNRRSKHRQLLAGPWQCSAQCRLRQAVREATRSSSSSSGCRSCTGLGGSGDLGERLAAARREALGTLRRDHCQQGGISRLALEDAICKLGQLADHGSVSEVACGEAARDGEDTVHAQLQGDEHAPTDGESTGRCSPHIADLRLRAAVKEVLQKRGCESGQGSSSRTTSMGSTRTSAACSAACAPAQVASVVDLPVREDSAADYVSMHDVDLRLRQVVSDELILVGRKAGVGASVAAVRREALASLRRQGQRRADGAVPRSSLEAAVARLRGAARGA
mmetsp:Transcript_22874/g.54155  ORF Transcript_22874/g.54155 Transcript_22874/m.54155 type:complete len:491 (+) Transcript_22874:52-1524(+)